jgi:hypothetical protein
MIIHDSASLFCLGRLTWPQFRSREFLLSRKIEGTKFSFWKPRQNSTQQTKTDKKYTTEIAQGFSLQDEEPLIRHTFVTFLIRTSASRETSCFRLLPERSKSCSGPFELPEPERTTLFVKLCEPCFFGTSSSHFSSRSLTYGGKWSFLGRWISSSHFSSRYLTYGGIYRYLTSFHNRFE